VIPLVIAAASGADQQEIDATDRQIDQLGYQLYGLTAEEIAIVEQATA
jgi:DNA-binding CsgD family transcriptional regulator